MNEQFVLGLARQGLTVALMLAAPALVTALVVGVAISIFQATTQIQEQTLTFVPKIVAVLVAMLIFGAWMLNQLLAFTEQLFGNLGIWVR
ncbi:MAG: flagellar biosynthesis protein FliQ [Clostridia bacterium]|nr:flagellar biosynthesis protein FliQ [Clostridia bacterium]MDH7573467.1 flagellar biosynthesis protein FliQ [Clostridia bacterium]